MPSLNTLKYNVTVKPSRYAAYLVFSLYGVVLVLLLWIFGLSWLTLPIFIILLMIASYGARKAYQQTYALKLSDSGRIEVLINGDLISGVIANASFYNGCFISLKVVKESSELFIARERENKTIVVYRDAVSDAEYRLLARVINLGR